MPKSLGQIHTVNFSKTVNASGDIKNCDLSAELTQQLQRMVRQGNIFKVVGIDLGMTTQGLIGGGQVSGYLRYYAPTKGRCSAYRDAYRTMLNAMKLQGINHRDNHQYDFKVGFNGEGPALSDGGTLENQASLDGTLPLTLGPQGNVAAGTTSVFTVHNSGVTPRTTSSTNLFPSGYNTMGVQSTPTDFVLNDSVIWTGNSDYAETSFEQIPFMMSWTPDSTDLAVSFNWRPDPALYLAILAGQIQVFIEELNKDGSAPALEIEMAIHIAGWKSFMSTKKSRKSRTKKSRKSSKRRSRKV